MSEEKPNGNGGAGRQESDKLTLMLTLDRHTLFVAISGDPLPVAIAQMMLDEAGRQLEQVRRLAAAQELQRQAVENSRVQSILNGARVGRG